MAVNKISLRKLLRLLMADSKKRKALLRDDIRSDIKKEAGHVDSGGDFFIPFWAAAKAHVKGWSNLAVDVPKLIALNARRMRLYNLMHKSFVNWWTEKRAWRNEPFTIYGENLKGQVHFSEMHLLVRVDNILAGTIAESEFRLVYPYFAEETALTVDGARLGIYILMQAMPDYPVESFRILDVIRGVSFSINDCPFEGNELAELKAQFQILETERLELSKEYV